MTESLHQRSELGPAPAQLVGDMAPGLVSGICIGLRESLTDRRGYDGVLALRDVRQRVSDPISATPLPAGAEHAGEGLTQQSARSLQPMS